MGEGISCGEDRVRVHREVRERVESIFFIFFFRVKGGRSSECVMETGKIWW